MRLALVVGLLFWAALVNAAELSGRVVHVADGDTVTVLGAHHEQHVVRLAGIDAPERGQPFGQVARRHLLELLLGQSVKVEWHKRDRYGRLVGRVAVEGRDVNLAQVQAGLAWHYVAYSGEQTEAERVSYAQAHRTAQGARLGLWRDPEPVAPWEWRRVARQKDRPESPAP